MTSPCPSCGAERRIRYAGVIDPETGETFRILECKDCAFLATDPQPKDLGPYYVPAYHGGRHGFTARLCAERRTQRLLRARNGRPGNLLDIGCGDGAFLLRAAHAGFTCTGTERNPEPARAHGIEALPDLDAAERKAPFDAITLWHVFEHVEDPRGLLLRIRGLLAPDGVLIIAVPDQGSLQARLFGRHWFHLDVPRHLWHFSARGLEKLPGNQRLQGQIEAINEGKKLKVAPYGDRWARFGLDGSVATGGVKIPKAMRGFAQKPGFRQRPVKKR